ncbi:kinase domain-containing protein [Xylariaceae sp. FL0804]|nr:kinase domain-containing protein [Xylariaceae sp. FL0804]
MRRSFVGDFLRRWPPSKVCRSPLSKNRDRRLHVPTMSNSDPLYQHIDDVERLDNYRRGGYHPIQIGDRLKKRYYVVHKLGYGTYSTIWLARDELANKYVAVKIGTADAGSEEGELLTRFAATTASHGHRQFGRHLVPAVLDRFELAGPNGIHTCLVSQPARCSLLCASTQPFELPVARSIAAQLAIAVAYMHQSGYVHGDLHRGNILLQLPSLDHLSVKQLYDRCGPPEPHPVLAADGQPISSPRIPPNVFLPAWLGTAGNEIPLFEAQILLTDFGAAFCPAHTPTFHSCTPLTIRPPEARFEPTTPLLYSSDIWSLGCVIWEILGVKPFLDSWLFSMDDATADQVDALGPMPDEWWDAWQGSPKHFVANGKPREGRDTWTFDRRFEDAIQSPRRRRGMEEIGPEERDALMSMVKDVLVFRPAHRLTAGQLLSTDWMRKWAIPAAQRTWECKGLFHDGWPQLS